MDGRRLDGPHPLDRSAVLLAFLAFPAALLPNITSVSPGGVGWGLALFVGALGFLMIPLPESAARTLALFLAFMTFGLASLAWTLEFGKGLQVLAQFAAVGVAYVAGWRAAAADAMFVKHLSRLATWLIPTSLIVFVNAAFDGASRFGWVRGGNTARPMVMMLALLFLLSTLGRSRRYTLTVFSIVALITIASGGRMGTAVLGVMLLLTPALRAGVRARAALLVAGLIILSVLIQFDSVQERLFVGRETGELTDIVALENNFNTAGRSQNWPRVIEVCSPQPVIGHGAGSAGVLTSEATFGRTPHPHNDFLRTFCEFGILGSALFWSFFLVVAARGIRLFSHRNASGLEAEVGAMGALAVVALLMFATTDNVIIYTATFMAAAGVIWGVADRTLHEVRHRQPLAVGSEEVL